MEIQTKQKFVEIKHWVTCDKFDNKDYLGCRIVPVSDAHNLIDQINQADDGYWTAKVVWFTENEYAALPLIDKKGKPAK